MDYFRIILLVFFGALPSLIWLAYYLRKDIHPEPKKTIVKIFLWGAIATLPALIMQTGLTDLTEKALIYFPFSAFPVLADIVKWFIVIALIEEAMKYFVVKIAILGGPDMDEPLDIMLYMVVAALGFAAMENALYLFSPIDSLPFPNIITVALIVSFIRFIGATFLHALVSALVGYFLARASIKGDLVSKAKSAALGLFLATLLHGLYNFSIITLSAPLNYIIPAMIIIGLAAFIIYDFDEVKKLKGICRV